LTTGRATSLGVILVHYHTPALLEQAVAAVDEDAAGSGIATEIVVVDNGSTEAERSRLAAFCRRRGIRLHDPGRNLGYAGGINAGAALLPEQEALLAMNTDVLVEKGCLAALLASLEAGAAVAGPAFFWDRADRESGFELPPTEAVGLGEDLLRVAAARWGGRLAAIARRRWRKHVRRYLLAEDGVAGYDLSGAMLMISAAAFHRVGGFDAGYAFYFEETDFLQRLRRAGLPARFERKARAVHLYAQSTPKDGSAAAYFSASQELFRRTFYRESGAALLRALSRGAGRPAEPPAEKLTADGGWKLDVRARWLEISPSPLGFPAATRRLPAGLGTLQPVLPPGLLPQLADGTYWLRQVDQRGGELAVGKLEIGA
jgi:GT2 family glycosyltransferase